MVGRFSCIALTIASFVLLSTFFENKANGMCLGERYQEGMPSFHKQAADKAESRIVIHPSLSKALEEGEEHKKQLEYKNSNWYEYK